MKKVLLSMALGIVVFSAEAEEEIAVAEEGSSYLFNSTYFGLGLGMSFLENEANLEVGGKKEGSIDKQSVDRFLGAVAFGGGKTFGKFYAGGELLIDFMQSKTQKTKYKGVEHGASIRNRGITPELAARFGFVQNGWMTYLKPGFVFPSATLRDNANKEVGSVSKVTYLIALGVEKFFCKKFSVRGEVEYVFPVKKTFRDDDVDIKTKTSGGFNIRALVAYNVQY